MNKLQTYIPQIIIITIFLGGLYFYSTYKDSKQLEGFNSGNENIRCPNLLLQNENGYYLYNTKLDTVPGVNPIVFNALEEYVDFLEWQHSIGIRCPVLYLQKTTNVQGNSVYKVRPNISDQSWGSSLMVKQHKNTGPTEFPANKNEITDNLIHQQTN